MSVITGRISDDTGDPIEGVTVMALRSRYWNWHRQLVPTGQAFTQTDDGANSDRPEVAIVPITVDSVDLTDVSLAGSEGGTLQYADCRLPKAAN